MSKFLYGPHNRNIKWSNKMQTGVIKAFNLYKTRGYKTDVDYL